MLLHFSLRVQSKTGLFASYSAFTDGSFPRMGENIMIANAVYKILDVTWDLTNSIVIVTTA